MKIKKIEKALRICWGTMKLGFIVFCVFIGSLFFYEMPLPADWVEQAVRRHLPSALSLEMDSLSFGLRRGLCVKGLRLYDETAVASSTAAGAAGTGGAAPMVSADRVELNALTRKLRIFGLTYPRLPESYYLPGVSERNAPLELQLPELGEFQLELIRPDILAVRPERVVADVKITARRVDARRIWLDWPVREGETPMALDGSAYLDLDRQLTGGKVEGEAVQAQIRPLLVALDVPVALPYVDGFTEVQGPVPSHCTWQVNLINNDFDLWLHLRPQLGSYLSVPMQRAEGKIHLHNFIRGTNLNYRQTIGPITAVDRSDRPLAGRVVVEGINGYNTVTVQAKSGLPVAQLLTIGGFTGDYVGEEVFGDSECDLEFRFPRAMTNNYEVLNGRGHVSIRNGQLMRLRGFRGLLDAMPSMVPAVSWFTDSTTASCDYVIENGVLKTDNLYIEGSMFSIKMYGVFDAVRNRLNFTVRVQFSRKDSLMGKVLHPITWPFTKLLLEFRLTGTPDNPRWNYLSVLDRVIEVME